MKKAAGLAIIYDKKILLVHPTNSPDKRSYSIPKGLIEEGESALDCAIRETFEETGLLISKEQIINFPHKCSYIKNGVKIKEITYFIVYLDKIDYLVIPKDKLQLDEVDWGGFLSYDEARFKINPKQRNIISNLKTEYELANKFTNILIYKNQNNEFYLGNKYEFNIFGREERGPINLFDRELSRELSKIDFDYD
jgi:ADP-ribose pyrophosphatase YjhB (NUDIX family)